MMRILALLAAIGLISVGLSANAQGQTSIADAIDETLQTLSPSRVGYGDPSMETSRGWGHHDRYVDGLALSAAWKLAPLRSAGVIESEIPWWPTAQRGFAGWFLAPHLASRKFRAEKYDHVRYVHQTPTKLRISHGGGSYTRSLRLSIAPSYLFYPREPDDLPDETLDTIEYSSWDLAKMPQLIALPDHPFWLVPDLSWAGISDK